MAETPKGPEIKTPSIPEKLAQAAQAQELKTPPAFGVNEEDVELLFGVQVNPDTKNRAQQRLDTDQQRLEANKGYMQKKQEVLLLLQQTADNLAQAAAARLRLKEAQGKISRETRQELAALDGYFRRTVTVVGQAIKLEQSPYAKHGQENVHAALQDTLNEREILLLQHFVDYLKSMDVEEAGRMFMENQPYISMLVEQLAQNGLLPKDYPVNTPEMPKAQAMVAENGPSEPNERIGHLGEIVRITDNEIYKENLAGLRRIILGLPEKDKDGKDLPPRSADRRAAEVPLWMGIVRNMNHTQRRDLVLQFLKNGSVEDAQGFISACIIGGAMTKEDAMNVYLEMRPGKDGKTAPDISQSGDINFLQRFDENEKFGGKKFEERLDLAVKAAKEVAAQMKVEQDNMTKSYQDNALTSFLTFNNLIIGRIMDLGVTTAVLNFVFDVADRIGQRGHRGESLGKAAALGVKDALKNKRFWGGLAVAGGAAELMVPWMKALVLRRSAEHEQFLLQDEGTKYIRNQVAGHVQENEKDDISTYFITHYSDYLETAKLNEKNTNPAQGKEKRGKFTLYEGDIKLTEKEAGKMGYASAKEAVATLHRFFDVCATANEIRTEEGVVKYFDVQIYGGLAEEEKEEVLRRTAAAAGAEKK